VPALAVVAGVAMLALAMTVWARGRVGDAPAPELEHGVYLGLAGHVFLLFVAAQPVLAVPPWPLFGVLAVLGLAVTVTALYLRRGDLHAAGVVASVMVVLVWAATAAQAPWPTIAIAAGLLVASLAMAPSRWRSGRPSTTDPSQWPRWPRRSRTRGGDRGRRPAWRARCGVARGAHVALLVLLFWQAQSRAWHRLRWGPWCRPALAVVLWQGAHTASAHWREQLIFALRSTWWRWPTLSWSGARPATPRRPWQAAVLGSAAFFFEARPALVGGGFGDVIGALPVAQALLLLGCSCTCCASSRPGARASARLAIVAGAALAFVTVAIPLQLEKEWITVGWALEGLALRVALRPHPASRAARDVERAARRRVRAARAQPPGARLRTAGTLRIFNWYLYATWCRRPPCCWPHGCSRARRTGCIRAGPRSTWLPTCATVLLFLLLNLEIARLLLERGRHHHVSTSRHPRPGSDLHARVGPVRRGAARGGIAVRSHAAAWPPSRCCSSRCSRAFLHDSRAAGRLYLRRILRGAGGLPDAGGAGAAEVSCSRSREKRP